MASVYTHLTNSVVNLDIYVDGEIFESRMKRLKIQKYLDTCEVRASENHDGNVIVTEEKL